MESEKTIIEPKKVRFRCSSLGDLMTKPKAKTQILSQTAKSMIELLWLKNEYGFYEEVVTDIMTKGTMSEPESRKMITKVLGGEPRFQFGKRLTRGNLSGSPDIVLKKEDVVEDVKNSFTLKTFFKASLTKNYEKQGQGYLYLAKKKKFRLIYTLQPTSQDIIENEKRRMLYKFYGEEDNPDYIEIAEQIEKNNDLINQIPLKDRVKVFESDYDQAEADRMEFLIEEGLEYYKTLKL